MKCPMNNLLELLGFSPQILMSFFRFCFHTDTLKRSLNLHQQCVFSLLFQYVYVCFQNPSNRSIQFSEMHYCYYVYQLVHTSRKVKLLGLFIVVKVIYYLWYILKCLFNVQWLSIISCISENMLAKYNSGFKMQNRIVIFWLNYPLKTVQHVKLSTQMHIAWQ